MRVQTFRSICLSALTSLSIAVFASQTYHVTDLGVLPNTYGSEGRAVNDAGVAVGICNDFADYPDQGFYYSGGSMFGLTASPGVHHTTATAINSSGQIAGDTDTGHAFLYSNGVMQDLGTLGSSESHAYGINDSGWVVGDSRILNYSAPHAFVYRNGAMQDLGTLAGSDEFVGSFANDVNNLGQVVGGSETSGMGGAPQHAFIWSNGAMSDLGTLGGKNSRAYGINDSGQVVGESQTSIGGDFHAFSYSNGLMTDIGTLGGTRSSAYGVNSSGVIVGTSWNSGSSDRGFIYRNGVMSDLNSMFDATSPTTLLTGAWGISDTGYIVGTAYVSGGKHAVLLTPNAVPEPSSFAALGFGAFALLRSKRGSMRTGDCVH